MRGPAQGGEGGQARARALLRWYAAHRRRLPWRHTRDPWAVLVSEVMLQQTQAVRVVPYYRRFLERFPTAAALADASPAAVLAAWSGLGYNRRALRLQRAAQHVAAHGWPTTAAALQTLPGVGPYTAAAVACFAFGEAVPTPDTNARRVASRWHGRPLASAELAAALAAELPAGAAAEWNQAVMDLGATLCRPADPACDRCPVARWCAGPATYSPPRPQGRFEGSSRQARGAVLRALLAHGPLPPQALGELTELGAERAAAAVRSLAAEGLVCADGGMVHLPE